MSKEQILMSQINLLFKLATTLIAAAGGFTFYYLKRREMGNHPQRERSVLFLMGLAGLFLAASGFCGHQEMCNLYKDTERIYGQCCMLSQFFMGSQFIMVSLGAGLFAVGFICSLLPENWPIFSNLITQIIFCVYFKTSTSNQIIVRKKIERCSPFKKLNGLTVDDQNILKQAGQKLDKGENREKVLNFLNEQGFKEKDI